MPLMDLCGPPDRARLDAAFRFQFLHDRLGHTIHTWLALGWCFFATWGTTVIEFALGPLVLYGVIRVLNTWRIWGVFWTRPAILLLSGFALWELAALAWSPDPAEGWNDLAKIRFGAATWSLWMVMDRRPWVSAALAAGFLVGNGVQAVDWFGATFGIRALDWHPAADRHSGWWSPAVAGSLLTAALERRGEAAGFAVDGEVDHDSNRERGNSHRF